jgi:hypothetical protein
VITARNKQYSSESHGDSNRCTPCRGKFNQHATHFPHSVHVWLSTICISRGLCIATFCVVVNGFEQIHCPREEGLPTQFTARRLLIRRSIPSFSPTITNKAVGKSQASVDNRLLGLLRPYRRHAIGTFNTCLSGPTHRSLFDTGGGYNLGGVSFPHHTPRPSQLTVLHFPPKGPPDLQINHFPPKVSKFKIKNLQPLHDLLITRPSIMAYIYA